MNPNQSLMVDGMPVDPKVVKVMKAIRQIESSGNYEAIGDGGTSAGAFQWNNGKEVLKPGQIPKNFWGHAQEAGVDVKDFSKASQNKVAYSIMKKWKDEGLGPEEIAARWNGASRDANGRYIYNAPEYGEKFRSTLLGNQAAPIGNTQFQQTSPVSPQGSLSQLETQAGEPEKPSQVDYRLGQGMDAINTFSQGVSNRNPLEIGSGVLQAGGALAGGFLDVTDAALKAVPVLGSAIEGAERAVGGVVGKAMETDLGQKAVGAFESLPENWQKNIGAAGNIASAIPVFRGIKGALGGVKNKLTDVVKGTPDDLAKKEMEQVISRTIPGNRAMQKNKGRGLDPVSIILKEAPPSLKKDAQGLDRYDASQSYQTLETTISKLDDQLDAKLQEATSKVPGYKGFWDLQDVKEDVIREIKKEFRGSPEMKSALKKVDDDFDSIIESFGGGRVDLNDINAIKRQVRSSVNFDSPSLDRSVRFHEGQAIMRAIERFAEQRGVKDIKELNRAMSERIEAQEILRKYIDNKSVVNAPGIQGLIGRQGDIAATAGGEALGSAFGAPVVGGVIGRALFDKAKQGPVSNLQRLNERRKPMRRKDLLVPPAALLANQSVQEERRNKQQ